MKYLGNNLYWFTSETAYLEYLKVGGYKGASLQGQIVHRLGDEVWAKILPNS